MSVCTTRSGAKFSPFERVRPASPSVEEALQAISTDLPLAPLLEDAFRKEDERYTRDDADCEGAVPSSAEIEPSASTSGTAFASTPPPSPPGAAPLPAPLHSLPGAAFLPTGGAGAVANEPSRRRHSAAEKARSKLSSARRRKSKKIVEKQEHLASHSPSFDYRARLSSSKRLSKLSSVVCSFKGRSLVAASGRWVGRRLSTQRQRPWTLAELTAQGFSTLSWDGETPQALLDEENRITAVLAGRPHGDGWSKVVEGATAAMVHEREYGERSGVFAGGHRVHRRGRFVALACGVSHGNGRLAPGNLKHDGKRRALLDRLLAHNDVKRIAGFQSSAFAFYAPKLHRHYCVQLRELFAHDSHLRANFSNSVFPAATFNLGPATVSLDHVDFGNVAYGWCGLTALGSYDATRGGHLILFDLQLIVEFPPGATILIPSSLLRHGNTPIQPGETRLSFTQYCSGGLFRWVDLGFRSAASFQKAQGSLPDDEDRVEKALQLFSTLDELHSNRVSCPSS